jgi:tetratricopeptide (TPR) repeat protein
MTLLYIQYTRSLKNRLLVLVSQGASHLQQSQYPQALQKCKEALAYHPQEANVLARIHLIMSQAHEKNGDYKLAKDSLSKAKYAQSEDLSIRNEIQNQKHNLKARIFLAEGKQHFKNQHYPKAVKSYQQGVAQNPLDDTLNQALQAHLSWARGEKRMERSSWDEALQHYQAGLDSNYPNPDVRANLHVRIGNAYVEKKEYALAEASYSEALKCNPTDPTILALIQTHQCNLQARNLLDQASQKVAAKQHNAALKYFDQASKLNPHKILQSEINNRRADCFLNLGQLKRVHRDFDLALQNFDAALCCYPTDINLAALIYLNKGMTHSSTEQYALAEASFIKASECLPTDLGIQEMLQGEQRNLKAKKMLSEARQNLAAHHYQETLQNYEEALACNPSPALQAKIHANITKCKINELIYQGQQNLRKKDYNLALQNFKEALALNPYDINDQAIIYTEMGNVHLGLQQYPYAELCFLLAANFELTDPALQTMLRKSQAALIYLNKGMTHSSAEQYALAEASFIKASEYLPTDLGIQEMIQGERRNLEAKKIQSQGLQNAADHKYDEAFQNFEAALACNPSSGLQIKIHANITKCKIDELIYRGQQNLKKQAYDAALQNFKDALALNPSEINDQVIIYDGMGNAHLGLQQYPYAEHCFILAANFNPSQPASQMMLRGSQTALQKALQAKKLIETGTKLSSEKKYEEALQHFEAALSYKPIEKLQETIHRHMESLAWKLYEKGLANYESNIIQALADFTLVLRCNPFDEELRGQIYYRLAKCYAEKPQPDYDQAFLYFSEALRFNFSRKMRATADRGIFYDYFKKEPQKAIQDYQVVIDSTSEGKPDYNPDLECLARLLKANVLRRQSLLSDELFKDNLEMVKQDMLSLPVTINRMKSPVFAFKVEAYYQRALCHHALEQLEDAEKLYSTVIDLAEHAFTRASALCDRALCYEKQGKDQKALQDYEQASGYALKEKERIDLQTCIDRAPLKALTGTPAFYQNAKELTDAISAGKSRVQQRLASPSPS